MRQQIQSVILCNRQGKVRLAKYYNVFSTKERTRMLRDVTNTITSRSSRLCNFIEWTDDLKLIFRRYASLYFIFCVDKDDNELLTLEIIHHFVEALDAFFGNVCELDLIVSPSSLLFPCLFSLSHSVAVSRHRLCVSFALVCVQFNFQAAYYILDELILAGEVQESSKRTTLRLIEQEDILAAEHQAPNTLSVLSRMTPFTS